MLIYDMRSDTMGDTRTLSAKVVWEDHERPSMELYFRVRSEESYFDLSNYNPFVIACVSPALHFGERRIRVEGEVCPWLADNLTTVMAYFNHWYW